MAASPPFFGNIFPTLYHISEATFNLRLFIMTIAGAPRLLCTRARNVSIIAIPYIRFHMCQQIRFARTRDHETRRIRRAAWPREAARNRRCLKAACQLLHSPTHNSPTHPSVLRTSSPCRLDLRSASDARVTNAACAAHEYACVAGFTNINHLCSTNGRSPV